LDVWGISTKESRIPLNQRVALIKALYNNSDLM
jgi:hypothetical protein